MTFQVPDDTSINNEEFKPGQYVIPLAPELIGFVIDDKKMKTYRFGNKYDYLRVGDEVRIQDTK